ncbi:MAG: peptidoglycan-binding protein [Candidatus Aureabacteria bacterium]|nr:peptidoglycan-binding protein [Candidatus Auribacterota bacterium]
MKYILLILLISLCTAGAAEPSITAKSAIIIEADTGQLLFEKSGGRKLYPASTVKLVTFLLALERLKLDDYAFVSSDAAAVPPSGIDIKEGDILTVDALLEALLLESANNAAVVIAEKASGSESGFVKDMNAFCRRIGAVDSYFINPNGLPGRGQYTTAKDLALIVRECVKKPYFIEVMRKRNGKISVYEGNPGNRGKLQERRQINISNHSRFAWQYPGLAIGKTGFTRDAGHCYAGFAEYGGKRIIVILLKCSHPVWGDLIQLLDYSFGIETIELDRDSNIKRNTRNEQILLKRAGCDPGPVDGIRGVLTVKAVKKFQEKNGLQVTGSIDYKTWEYMKKFFKEEEPR